MSEITKFESAPIANISDFVQIKDEQVYTTSRIVAEKFGKEHSNVLKAIEATIKDIVASQPIENIREVNFDFSKYFIQSDYSVEGQTRVYKEYLITEDGLALLVMGFTGVDAMRIKLNSLQSLIV